jgi:predicted nucleic acid-binding protein
MELSRFNLSEPIFIDSNIFAYHYLNNPAYGNICTNFLDAVELGSVDATTSLLAIDEVIFVILITKGSEVLQTRSTKTIREKLKSDVNLSKTCFNEVRIFLSYLKRLTESGLKIIGLSDSELFHQAIEFAYGKYKMLPRDMILLKQCIERNIKNIATQDSDFDSCAEVTVWKPKP